MIPELSKKPLTIRYPSTDGKPMANGTEQYDWIVTIKGNLDIIYYHDDEVFIAGDIFWYPVEGNNKIVVAPDVLIVFGRPRGKRDSYLQWKEDNIAPQVVFEIVSPSNSFQELANKFAFYESYGVEEYYLIRPDQPAFEGWIRQEGRLVPIAQMDGWVSPRLKIRFDLSTGDLVLYRPDGVPFLTHAELNDRVERFQLEAAEARERAERLAAKLRELGLDPDAL